MASKDEKSLADLPSWRIVVLFFSFIVITVLWEKFTHYVDHLLARKKRKGLRHTFHKLQEELLALGLISFLLIVVEEYLVELCVDDDDYKSDKYGKNYEGDKSSSKDDYGGDSEEKEAGYKAGLRLLLAAAGGKVCPKGEESFWTIRALHETHIFIFMLAVTHITYAGLSIVLCTWKLAKWKKWEQQEHDLLRSDFNALLEDRSGIFHFPRAFIAQFSDTVDKSVYLGLRRLFIERLEVPDSFDFHSFLVDTMEEEFSKVVKLEWLMWAIGALWIGVSSVLIYVMTGLAVVTTLVVGTKLQSIALRLGNEAFNLYADKPPPGAAASGGSSLVRRSLQRLSGSVKAMACFAPTKDAAGDVRDKHIKAGDPVKAVTMTRYPRHDSDFEFNMENSDRGTPRGTLDKTSYMYSTQTSFDSAVRYDSKAVGEVPVEVPGLQKGQQSNERGTGPEERGSISGNKDGLVAPNPADDRYLHESMQTTSWADSDDEEDGQDDTQADYGTQAAADGNSPTQVYDGQQSGWVEARIVGFSGFAKWLWWRMSGKHHVQHVKALRQRTFSKTYLGPDAVSFFWFERPRIMLKAFQYTYFETSLVCALLLFNKWQELDFIVGDSAVEKWAFRASVIVGVILMIFSSLFLLPVYALTMVVGSHCPESVLKKARKKKIPTKMVNVLERMSIGLKRMSMKSVQGDHANASQWHSVGVVKSSSVVETAEAKSGQKSPTPPELDEVLAEVDKSKEQTPLNTLVGAMLKEKVKQWQLEHSPELRGRPSLSTVSTPAALAASGRRDLSRVSLPNIQIYETGTDGDVPHEPPGEPSLGRRSLGKQSVARKPSLSRQSLPPILARSSLPMMGLHDIEEVSSPKVGSPKPGKHPRPSVRSSGEEGFPNQAQTREPQALNSIVISDAPESPRSGSPSPTSGSSSGAPQLKPDLATRSLPLTKVAKMKRSASLQQLHDIHEEDHHHEEPAAQHGPPELKRSSMPADPEHVDLTRLSSPLHWADTISLD